MYVKTLSLFRLCSLCEITRKRELHIINVGGAPSAGKYPDRQSRRAGGAEFRVEYTVSVLDWRRKWIPRSWKRICKRKAD